MSVVQMICDACEHKNDLCSHPKFNKRLCPMYPKKCLDCAYFVRKFAEKHAFKDIMETFGHCKLEDQIMKHHDVERQVYHENDCCGHFRSKT